MTEAAAPGLLVRKEITVEASQTRAFNVFTQEHGAWWPLATHHIGAAPAGPAVSGPRVGGGWFERGGDAANANGVACWSGIRRDGLFSRGKSPLIGSTIRQSIPKWRSALWRSGRP